MLSQVPEELVSTSLYFPLSGLVVLLTVSTVFLSYLSMVIRSPSSKISCDGKVYEYGVRQGSRLMMFNFDGVSVLGDSEMFYGVI